MEKGTVIQKIKEMPDSLMGIVSEFLDKLAQGYEAGLKNDESLTPEEQKEILEALSDYEAAPDSGIDWETLKQELKNQYSIS